jgi:hypothetical protein
MAVTGDKRSVRYTESSSSETLLLAASDEKCTSASKRQRERGKKQRGKFSIFQDRTQYVPEIGAQFVRSRIARSNLLWMSACTWLREGSVTEIHTVYVV